MTINKSRHIIRGLAPGSGFLAVWSHVVEDSIEIETRPLDFIALDEIQKDKDGEWIYDDWELVGIELTAGFFDVVTDSENCHGIVRDGATWAERLELVPRELQARVMPPSVSASESHAL
jgi:hypothetical protein